MSIKKISLNRKRLFFFNISLGLTAFFFTYNPKIQYRIIQSDRLSHLEYANKKLFLYSVS